MTTLAWTLGPDRLLDAVNALPIGTPRVLDLLDGIEMADVEAAWQVATNPLVMCLLLRTPSLHYDVTRGCNVNHARFDAPLPCRCADAVRAVHPTLGDALTLPQAVALTERLRRVGGGWCSAVRKLEGPWSTR